MKFGYTYNFWIMSFSMFLFMTGFNLIIPELNQFISELGGASQKGLIISIFTISAGISRPFSGKLADLIGRKKVMIIGVLICFIVSVIYPLSFSVWFFLLLRFIHGFSVGFMPTGATALITDIIPENKRGQAMGIWGTFISLGIGVGQSLGSIIHDHLGMNNLFMISAGIATLSGILLAPIDETLQLKQKFKFRQLIIKKNDIVEPSVIPAAVVMFLSATCSGVIFVITPDLSSFLKIENKGYFFGIYVLSTILIRLFTSSLSDKIGRRQTLLIGMCILFISMFLIAFSNDIYSYSIAALVFGVATGISSPTLFAWTADLSHPERRGVGAGTMFIALELGIMTGSLSTLLTYQNNPESIINSFLVSAFFAMAALVYLVYHLKSKNHSEG